MRARFHEALAARGARVEGARVVGFRGAGSRDEARLARTAPIVADLSHRALVRATGPEAEHYLQNQLTNDVREIAAGKTRFGAYCMPKGRVLGLFRLFRAQGAIHLECPEDAKDRAIARLRMMILRAKVALEDAENELLRLGVCGPDASERLASALDVPCPVDETVIEAAGVVVMALPGPTPRFMIAGDDGALVPLFDRLVAAGSTPVGANAWDLAEIEDGLPRVHAETQEAFLPQFLDLEALHGLSYTKGCFPGQEVVARTHYLGRTVRTLVRGTVDAEPPAPGTPLRVLREDGDREGGVVAAAALAVSGSALLAVCPVEDVEAGRPFRLGAADGPEFLLAATPRP